MLKLIQHCRNWKVSVIELHTITHVLIRFCSWLGSYSLAGDVWDFSDPSEGIGQCSVCAYQLDLCLHYHQDLPEPHGELTVMYFPWTCLGLTKRSNTGSIMFLLGCHNQRRDVLDVLWILCSQCHLHCCFCPWDQRQNSGGDPSQF